MKFPPHFWDLKHSKDSGVGWAFVILGLFAVVVVLIYFFAKP
jgi:hypothetical protein